jgi:NAD(P)-dependent dehydrogenase (short-subunit alcohol dehydrogenase family)
MSKLQNKIAVITGGNSGIGLATAQTFKDQGATVIITARSKETYDIAYKEFGSKFDVVQADITKITDIENLYAHVKLKYGKIDILFANAGIAHFLPTELVEESFFDNQFNTNVKGLYFTVAKALPLLNQGAKIILNASAVSTKGLSGASVYSATKAAVRSFARIWATELAPRQIRVNVVSPGPVETPIYSKMKMDEEQMKDFSTFILNSVPLHRFANSDEIARTVLFLASDDSSYMTGVDLVVDGGFSQV